MHYYTPYIYIYIYIFGFGLSSSVLSKILVLASIARRINATSRAPLLYLVSRMKICIFIYIYNVPSDDVVSSKLSSRGITRGIAALLGILASAGRTRITGVLLHGTFCCFRVQFIRTHATLIILVIWFTNAAHFVPSYIYSDSDYRVADYLMY